MTSVQTYIRIVYHAACRLGGSSRLTKLKEMLASRVAEQQALRLRASSSKAVCFA